MNMKAIFAVMNAIFAVVKIRCENPPSLPDPSPLPPPLSLSLSLSLSGRRGVYNFTRNETSE